MVSTDDNEIASLSKELGAQIPFLRPKEFASDKAKTLDAVLHATNNLYDMGMVFDDLVLLQPTQPLRTAEDIDRAIEKYFENGCKDLASVSEVDDNPILIRFIKNDELIPILNMSSTCRRQDMPKYYRVNGCIYINNIRNLNENTSFNDNIIPYIMKKEHSIDIDDYFDFSGSIYRPHLSGGAGLKVAMNENFILSVDWATPFSSKDSEKKSNMYIKMGYLF